MTLKVEGVVNRTVHAEEALGGSSRLEPLQLALASSDCLMRILRPIVFPKPLLMPTGQSKTPERGGVGAQLVGDQQFRHEALLLEQLAHQPQRRPTVASALDQHVEDLALVIDGAPEIRPLAGDAHHHLVQMPAIARPRATLAQPSRDRGTELQHPSPHRFVGDVEPSFGQQLLDIAVAQGEAEIEPDRVLDDLGREAMAAVAERAHADILSDTPLASDPVSVTMPSMFEPIHGSAFDITGKGIANPVATFWTAAMMLEHLGEKPAAERLMKAVEHVTADPSLHTPDLGGKATTKQVTDAVCEAQWQAND